MRTTIDLPDDLYRSLKARAALSGAPVRDVIARLIDLGLRSDLSPAPREGQRRAPPPVAIPPRGVPVVALSHEDKTRMDEIEDEAKLARSA